MSEPTPPKAQSHHGHQSYTSTWRDDAGRSHCKRFGRVGAIPKAQAVARWKVWLDTEYAAIRQSQAARYPVSQLCKDYFAKIQSRYTTPDGKDRKSTRLNSSHIQKSRMPSSA